MDIKTITKQSDRHSKPPPQLKRLQEIWYAIGDLASLLQETHSDGVTNPCYILRILTDELGEVVTEMERKFDKQVGGAA